ncbi:MAG: sigma 54-interacting transcriptional regulator [Syntrophaceae bacterium]|nr:sigma 54-interacting transcriptional regulator [Syntrophaceae bacterium]
MQPSRDDPVPEKGENPRGGKTDPPGEGVEDWLHSFRVPAELRERVRKFAASGLPVFIQGEEGTGKSAVARVLHFWGPWKKSPFLRIPCRGLTPSDFVEKISVWGEEKQPGGRVSLTLFLENLGRLQDNMQALLQELLSSRQVPWPGLEETIFDVQVLSSSTGDMAESLADEGFRPDLFRTLETLTLRLPPLRERKEELPRIVQEILREKERQVGGKKGFSPEAIRVLQEYDWPGNLAELESMVLRSAVLKDGNLIEPADLAFNPSCGPSYQGTPFRDEKDRWFDVTIPTLAHEIKNPLVAISTFAHLLPNKYDDPEFRQEFSRLVNQDVGRINALIENLLEFAQFSPPRSSLQDLNAALGEFLEKYRNTPGKANREVMTDLENGLPPILFDKTQLNFILRNLLENVPSRGNDHSPLNISTRFPREETTGRGADSVDLILWYHSPEGFLGNFSRIVGFETNPELQNLNLSLLLIQKVMLNNRGKMQVRKEADGGITLLARFPAGKSKRGVVEG